MPEGGSGNVYPLFSGIRPSREARTPPHNEAAEQTVLGSMLARPAAIDQALETLRPEHFYFGLHARLYTEIAKRHLAGKSAKPALLKPWVEADPDGKELGGMEFLANLLTHMVRPDLDSYIQEVLNNWKRREAIARAEEAIEAAYDPSIDIHGTFLKLANDMDAVTSLPSEGRGDLSADQAMDLALARIEEDRKSKGSTVLKTGFPSVDKTIIFRPKRIAVVGGATGIGKSSLGWGWAVNMALQLRDLRESGANLGGILGVSLEMGAEDLMLRAACSASGVSFEKADAGELTRHDEEALQNARDFLRSMPLTISDINGLSPTQIRMKARQAQRKFGKLALIVVDHITLVKPEAQDAKNGGPWAMGQVINTLLGFAQEFECSLLVLAQLKRDVSERENHRPQITDLAWASAIEQAAHYIALLHRPEYFIRKDEPIADKSETPEAFNKKKREWQALMNHWDGRGQLFIDKVRGGALRTVPLIFEKQRIAFSEELIR